MHSHIARGKTGAYTKHANIVLVTSVYLCWGVFVGGRGDGGGSGGDDEDGGDDVDDDDIDDDDDDDQGCGERKPF